MLKLFLAPQELLGLSSVPIHVGTQCTCDHATCKVQMKSVSGINGCLEKLHKPFFLKADHSMKLDFYSSILPKPLNPMECI